MKMERREDFESFEEQEKRAQQRLHPGALMKAALIAGGVVFVVPAGGPWMSQEAFVNVMGRGMGTQALLSLIGHFTLAVIYGWIIGSFIYRQPLGGGLAFGTMLAAPLYAINYVLFALVAGYQANEIHAAISHLMFCLFFSVCYRALAVPKPLRKHGAEAQADQPVKSGGLGT